MQQIMDLQQQKQTLEQQQLQPPAPAPPSAPATQLESIQVSLQQTIQNLSQANASTTTQPPPYNDAGENYLVRNKI